MLEIVDSDERRIDMSKSEILHELFLQCQDITIYDTQELVTAAQSEEEAGFISVVTDYVLQMKQKQVIAQKEF